MKQHREHYRAVFISDLHLGSRGSKAKNLLAFLKSIECEQLYLVGDVFDMWAMKSKIWWNEDCTAVIRRILKMMKHGTKVTYLAGNHDDAMRHFIPISFGTEIEIVDEAIHVTSSGDRYLIIHGDIFDFVARWLAIVGAHIYDWLLACNGFVHKIRLMVGFKNYWSLSGYLKKKTKRAVSAVKDFETAVLRYAAKKNCTGVICGHIHSAKLYTVNGIKYVNCGDWVESLTAIVEDRMDRSV